MELGFNFILKITLNHLATVFCEVFKLKNIQINRTWGEKQKADESAFKGVINISRQPGEEGKVVLGNAKVTRV